MIADDEYKCVVGFSGNSKISAFLLSHISFSIKSRVAVLYSIFTFDFRLVLQLFGFDIQPPLPGGKFNGAD